MKQAIHQLVAGFRSGDAISNTAVMLRGVFRAQGFKSEIYCGKSSTSPYSSGICDSAKLPTDCQPNDIVILHLSIGCDANLLFASLNCRKAIIYHNITPSHFFQYISTELVSVLERGRKELVKLAGVAQVNMAVSRFNAQELEFAGYKDTKVFPLPIDLSLFQSTGVDCGMIQRLSDGHKNVLFVGRFAPNKRIEDLLRVVYFLSKIEPSARFIHVGSVAGMEAYQGFVLAQLHVLGLKNVLFLDSVTQEVLNACYTKADAFLCMSEHEGFCAPLVEAMLYHVPIFARSSSAIPETLGGSGVLFEGTPTNYPLIAESIAESFHNSEFRSAVIAKQDERLEAIRNRDVAAEILVHLKPLLG